MNAHELKQVKYFLLSGRVCLWKDDDGACTEEIKTGFIIEKKDFFNFIKDNDEIYTRGYEKGESEKQKEMLAFADWYNQNRSDRMNESLSVREHPLFDTVEDAFQYWKKTVNYMSDYKIKVFEILTKSKLEIITEPPKGKTFPVYAKLGDVALRYIGNNTYHRDAGHWDVKVTDDLKILTTGLSQPVGSTLTPINEETWRESNCGYI